MTHLKNIRIAFDNAGGAHIWTRNYAHSYHDGKRLAADVIAIFAGSNINNWDGNDEAFRDAMRKDLTGCENFPGRYDVYTLNEIAALIVSAKVEIDEGDVFIRDGRLNSRLSGFTETVFFRALCAR